MSGAERGEKGPRKESDCFFFLFFLLSLLSGKDLAFALFAVRPWDYGEICKVTIALCCTPLEPSILLDCRCCKLAPVPAKTLADNWRISASIPPPRRVCPILSLSSRKSALGPGGGFARTDAGATPLSAPPRANAVTVSRRLFYSIAAGNSCCDGRGDCPASGVCVHVVADRPTWIYADSPITRARASFFVGGQSARGSRPLRLR